MLQKIKSGNFYIYTNEVVHPLELNKLYNKEKILQKFDTKVTTVTHHPFATFLANERNLTTIKSGDVVILRATKNNKKFEFISKIREWGKFSIPKIVIKTLNIRTHEKINFEVIKEAEHQKLENEKDDIIDLMNIKQDTKIYMIRRENNFITLFKESKIPITLPRFIEISPELIELFFLIHGDGHYKTKLFFVNKSPELHKFVIEKFEEIFRIPINEWRYRLLYNNLSMAEDIQKYWKKILNVKEEQFYPSISKTELKTNQFGNLRIGIDKTLVALIFRFIFDQIKIQDEKSALHALNGLLYAEGGTRKNKKGLHKITLSFSSKEKEMFEDILKNIEMLKIFKIEQNSRFCISGWKNLYSFFKLFFSNNVIPFDIHTQRCKNALEGFLNHGFTQTLSKYVLVLNSNKEFRVKDIANETGYRPTSILNTLRKKQYSNFIEIKGKG